MSELPTILALCDLMVATTMGFLKLTMEMIVAPSRHPCPFPGPIKW